VATFDYGFNTANIFTARVGLFENDYPTTASQLQFYDRVVERLEGRPGIRSVAWTSDLPARGGQMHPLTVDGVAYQTAQDHPLARRIVVSPSHFDIVGVSALRGRVFGRGDGPVVSEHLVTTPANLTSGPATRWLWRQLRVRTPFISSGSSGLSCVTRRDWRAEYGRHADRRGPQCSIVVLVSDRR
jgi:hypothetical protein